MQGVLTQQGYQLIAAANGVEILKKPFSPRMLLTLVRMFLDRPTR
jgi:DNA-binding response OmpR family regulator